MGSKESFLSELFKKRAAVVKIRESSGVRIDAALEEVDRQIQEALRGGGDSITGEGVTKSGEED